MDMACSMTGCRCCCEERLGEDGTRWRSNQLDCEGDATVVYPDKVYEVGLKRG